MANYKVAQDDVSLASDVNQYADTLSGNADVGSITLAPVVAAPSAGTATAVAGSGLGVGAYVYSITYVTGFVKSDGTNVISGETSESATFSVTTTAGNQAVSLTGLPTTSATTVVAKRLYRTAVGGSQRKLVTTLTPSATTYSDTTADASLGANAPTSNTTGTYMSMNTPTASGHGATKGYVDGTFSTKTYVDTTFIAIPASSAQGDILIRSASGWTRLPAGTSGQVLRSNGAGADPTWVNIDMPWLIDVDVFMTPIAQTNWSTLTVLPSNAALYNGILTSSGAQNAEINFNVVLAAGTWTVEVMYGSGTDCGIISVQFDSVEKGTIDTYNGTSYTHNQKASVSGIVVPSTGKVQLKLKMATKNASSSNYKGIIQHIQLRRTA